MALDKYISNIDFILNGQVIDDWKTFEEDPRVKRKAVALAKKTGVLGVTPRYGFTLGYCIPGDKPEFDFENVEGATVVIEKENGVRVTFTDVYVLEIGAEKYDGENEAVKDIKFIAGDRIQE